MVKIDINKIELVWPAKFDDKGKIKNIDRLYLPFQIIERIDEAQSIREAKIDGVQKTLFDYWNINENVMDKEWKNKLIWGDNKIVMSSLLEKFAGKINLIYIDPPFTTGADIKLKIKLGTNNEETDKEHSILEEKAYRDTWGSGFDFYLRYMYERLVLMRELLAENGSIYIHLDWHVGHYIKLIMDEIFGYDNFRNEIVWRYGKMASSTRKFLSNHDIVLFYSKTDKFIFNPQFLKLDKPIRRLAREVKDGRLVNKKDKNGKLVYINKDIKIIDDVWDDIPIVMHASPQFLDFSTQKPENLLKRIILTSSNPEDLVADFFCGSGTTLAVAEKLNRKWIGCDLSRYSIHLTRKRLQEIKNSKDLIKEKSTYNNKVKPFEIINLGKYERQLWQDNSFSGKDKQTILYEYLAFILKLYGAKPIMGFTYIHGKKGKALIHIGSVNSPVTIEEILSSIKETIQAGTNELHILGWEWEMGLHDLIEKEATKEGIKLVLKLISNEVIEEEAVRKGDVRFFDLAYLKTNTHINGKTVSIELTDFVIPNIDLIPKDVREKITKWSDYIDYWAVDFNFKEDTFVNQWTSYRTKKNRVLKLISESYTYNENGTYKILVKVIDIFGNDTSQVFEIEVK